MARAAVLGRLADDRLRWRVCTLTEERAETPTARTLVLDVPGWPGHLGGQHVDVRLTAEDGYSTQRSYSIASAPDGDRLELTVQRVTDGEVSPYLIDQLTVGDRLELRGPVGGWFVWRPDQPEPVLLIAGGSGIVPLMAMIRVRRAAGSGAPFRLIYSVRAPEDCVYRAELGDVIGERADGLATTLVFTRRTPADWPRPPGRLVVSDIEQSGWPVEDAPAVFVCGPTGFVEHVADLLVDLGHDPAKIRTERFGPTGG